MELTKGSNVRSASSSVERSIINATFLAFFRSKVGVNLFHLKESAPFIRSDCFCYIEKKILTCHP